VSAKISRFVSLLKTEWRAAEKRTLVVRLGRVLRVFTYPFYRAGQFIVVRRPLSLPNERPVWPESVTVRRVEPADLPGLRQISNSADGPRLEAFTRRGSLGILAERGGEMLGYMWASFAIFPQLHRVAINLDPQEAFIHDIWVVPAARREGLASAMLWEMINTLQGRALQYVVSHVVADNQKALAFHARHGYKPMASLSHRRILRWDFYHQTPYTESSDFHK